MSRNTAIFIGKLLVHGPVVCYAATKHAQKAKEVVEELASMNSAKAPTNYDWEVLG
jgi:hypothetical protein